MDKKWWMIKIKCICINKGSKKILLKIRITNLLKYVQKMMHFLAILNSQPMKLLYIMILKIHQSMQLTYRLLNGKDHKRLLLKGNLKCIEIKWVQEILNKEFWEIAGFWDLFWFVEQTLNYWLIYYFMMEFSMVLRYLDFSKMEDGNTS